MRNWLSFFVGLVIGGALTAGAFVLYLTPSGGSTITTSGESAGPVTPQQDAANDPVRAVVNGQKIRQSDIKLAAEELPPQYQAQLDAIMPLLIDRVIDLTLVDQMAEKADGNLANDPTVLAAVEKARTNKVRSIYIQNLVKAKVTDAAIQEQYNKTVASVPATEEVRARHILVEKEEDAKAIIKQLDNKADFAALAKEKSIDKGSGAEGGDLGYFTKEQMVEPFANAAFALKPGEYTKEPVQSQFGWHVILVEDRRQQEKPTLESMKSQIESELSQQAVEDLITELRGKATIERFNEDGTPAKPETQPVPPAGDATGGQAPSGNETPATPVQ